MEVDPARSKTNDAPATSTLSDQRKKIPVPVGSGQIFRGSGGASPGEAEARHLISEVWMWVGAGRPLHTYVGTAVRISDNVTKMASELVLG